MCRGTTLRTTCPVSTFACPKGTQRFFEATIDYVSSVSTSHGGNITHLQVLYFPHQSCHGLPRPENVDVEVKTKNKIEKLATGARREPPSGGGRVSRRAPPLSIFLFSQTQIGRVGGRIRPSFVYRNKRIHGALHGVPAANNESTCLTGCLVCPSLLLLSS